MNVLPFPGGLSATPNGWLVLSVAAAILYGFVLTREENLRRTIVKTMAVGLLAMLTVHLGGPVLLIAALGLSALGDAFLAHEGERAFMGGLSSFLLAHICYVVLFFLEGPGLAGLMADFWRMVYVATLVLGAIAVIKILWSALGNLKAPVLLYVLAIILMGIGATSTGNLVLIAGTLAFIVSDGLLATEKFLLIGPSPWRLPMKYAVWILYYLGQLLITLAIIGSA